MLRFDQVASRVERRAGVRRGRHAEGRQRVEQAPTERFHMDDGDEQPNFGCQYLNHRV